VTGHKIIIVDTDFDQSSLQTNTQTSISTSQGSLTPWASTPLNPPAISLAVRSPYVGAWLRQGGISVALNEQWPTFWRGQALGWAGLLSVDGKVYSFLGLSHVGEKAEQKSFEYTATKSVFVLSAGPVDLTATFLSPVEVSSSLPRFDAKLATDTRRLSLPTSSSNRTPFRTSRSTSRQPTEHLIVCRSTR
jgi:hypothetical protein